MMVRTTGTGTVAVVVSSRDEVERRSKESTFQKGQEVTGTRETYRGGGSVRRRRLDRRVEVRVKRVGMKRERCKDGGIEDPQRNRKSSLLRLNLERLYSFFPCVHVLLRSERASLYE